MQLLRNLSLALCLICVDAAQTFTQQTCITYKGTSSVKKVPTTTNTYTFHFTGTTTKKVTPTSTITPAPSTITTDTTTTVTSTSTLMQQTDTSTSTVETTTTETTVSLTLVTTTATATATTTTTTALTVPTPAGFTPAVSALSGEGYTASKHKRDEAKSIKVPRRALEAELSLDPRSATCPKLPPHNQRSKYRYAKKVVCKELVEVITYTTAYKTQPAKTVTATPMTSTDTITSTATSVSTVMPSDASTTVTSTSTVTTQTTSTNTVNVNGGTTTTTQTSTSYTSTTYLQCATDGPNQNIVSTIDGDGIYTGAPTVAYGSPTQANSGYDCCVQCAQSTNCSYFAFAPGNCYLPVQSQNQCDPSSVGLTLYYNSNYPAGSGYQAGSGQCGIVNASNQ